MSKGCCLLLLFIITLGCTPTPHPKRYYFSMTGIVHGDSYWVQEIDMRKYDLLISDLEGRVFECRVAGANSFLDMSINKGDTIKINWSSNYPNVEYPDYIGSNQIKEVNHKKVCF